LSGLREERLADGQRLEENLMAELFKIEIRAKRACDEEIACDEVLDWARDAVKAMSGYMLEVYNIGVFPLDDGIEVSHQE
jgi:hypothetical protein